MYTPPEVIFNASIVTLGILTSADYTVKFYYGIRDWQKRKRAAELDERDKRFIRNSEELNYYVKPLGVLIPPFVDETRRIYNLVVRLKV